MRLTTRVRAALGALAIAAPLFAVAAPAPAFANNYSIRWQLPPGQYGIGIDHVCGGQTGPLYEQYYEWPSSVYNVNPIATNPITVSAGCNLDLARMEIFTNPGDGKYDPWSGSGAVALRLFGSTNVGMIPIPTTANAGRLRGNLVSRGANAEGRLQMDIFQISGQPLTSTGVPADAFSSSTSRGNTYQTGPLWNGEYIAVVTDKTTGNIAQGFMDVNGDTSFDLDLDAVCFGIDACSWTGSVGQAAGAFHPLAPTRIADTRVGQGIAHGAVTPGDGRNSDPNYELRLISYENHELQVTGVGGVPASGASAVLLNVTASSGTTGGSLKVFPKPANTDAFDHQSSFGTIPTSTQLYWKAGEDVPNLVLAKVGSGGKVRIANVSYGPVHVIVDVVGWYDQGQPGQAGAGLVALAPERFLDTRSGVGGPKSPFAADTTRGLKVAGAGRVPANAVSVIGTVTGINPTSQTYITAWPAAASRPNASVLNVAPNDVRPNLVTVGPNAQGEWSLYNERGNHDLLVDVSGYYVNNGGGRVTATEATPILDTIRNFKGGAFSQNETRALKVTDVGGVPGDATAVLLNVSVLDGTASSFMTVFPGGQSLPDTSNLNWNVRDRRSNLVVVPVGAGGNVNLFNAFGQVHVAVEIVGWVR
jgi:hypothetical protein